MDIEIGATYTHYKRGGEYKIIGIGRHSETLEEMVVYQALYDTPDFGKNPIWIRPKEMFLELVDDNGAIVLRFQKIKK
jgi:hypothetical protein